MPKTLKVLDLFSGVGGFSLGLERAKGDGEYSGFETVAFCEIEDFPRRVLAKHWPNVPCYRDVRELTSERLRADGIVPDVICGGFPCQDLSVAGQGAGLAGERSGLWSEIARLASELRPRYIIVENVAALLGRGLGTVLGDLAALGFNAEWHCIPASYAGAPHRRDRIWIVAYPNGGGHDRTEEPGICAAPIGQWISDHAGNGSGAPNVADAASGRWDEGHSHAGRGGQGTRQAEERAGFAYGSWWRAEPDVGRVANGVPDRAHRLKGLGNAVVPQVVELIGHAILASLDHTLSKQAEVNRPSNSFVTVHGGD